MEYKRLASLENTYPQSGNYIVNRADTSVTNLYGLYSDKNKLDFKLPSLKDLKSVEGTNFRFIVAIFRDYQDSKPIYYTSEKYLNDLKASAVEGNPYFLQASFSNSNIVSYVYEDILKISNSMKLLEKKSRVEFRTNIFIENSGSFNYDNFITYLDWLVDKPSPLDDVNFGVLEPTTISGWDVYDGNFATGEVKTTVSASYGIGSSFVSVLDSSKLDAEANLKFEQEKLEKIKKQIDAINLELKTKANYKLPALTSAYTTVDGVVYTATNDISLFARIGGRNNNKREKAVSDKLLEEINRLNTKKIELDKSVADAQSKFNIAQAAAKDLINKGKEELDKLKNISADLINKIPKIPKLPPIPKIPKLPSAGDLANMALSLLPPIPLLPKLPSLPKLPKFKLPPLKLFKPKKPKEPKKVKKNKGKGIKGALGDLQNAANSAQAAVGAAAAAAGAAASVQNAANQAQSAVANAQSAVANAQSAVGGLVDTAKSTASAAVSNIQSAAKDTISNVKNNIPKI